MQKDKATNIVVTGASAGGITAVARLCAQFDATVDADQLSLGTQIQLTCPSCGGNFVLIENEERPRYCCYMGHSFTRRSLATERQNALENSIWVAIPMIEERLNLLTSRFIVDRREKRTQQLNIHIKRLKEMLLQMGERSTETEINQNLN